MPFNLNRHNGHFIFAFQLLADSNNSKEGEIDTAVSAMLKEVRMGGKIVVLAMLEYKKAAFAKNIRAKHKVR